MKIHVGPKRKLFEVHKDLLIAKSGYFKRMLSNDDWEETRKGEVYWVDEDETPETMEVMINWLYDKTIDMEKNDLETIFKTYSLAHKREMISLKNALVDNCRRRLWKKNMFVRPETIQNLRNRGLIATGMQDMLFKTLIFQLGTHGKGFTMEPERLDDTRKFLKDRDPSLMADIIESMMIFQWKKYDDPRQKEGCYFHDHSDGSSCA